LRRLTTFADIIDKGWVMSGYQPQGYDPRQQRPVTPPQWQRSAPPPYNPNPALTGYTDRRQAPAAPQRQAAPPVPHSARRRPPYPAHLVRFPSHALPRSRRKRGPSLGRIFYLGRHPIALLIEMVLTVIAFEVILAWIALVAAGWAAWVILVTIAWACRAAAAAMSRA
jgi:hypothetical protein